MSINRKYEIQNVRERINSFVKQRYCQPERRKNQNNLINISRIYSRQSVVFTEETYHTLP